jgi:hypothetical protein
MSIVSPPSISAPFSFPDPLVFFGLKNRGGKKILRDEHLSVGEIADRLGYSGIHSFSRAFKTATGFSPSGYKKSIL